MKIIKLLYARLLIAVGVFLFTLLFANKENLIKIADLIKSFVNERNPAKNTD